MTKHLLNEADVRAILEHQCGHGVTKEMTRTFLPDARLLDVVVHHRREEVPRDRLAAMCEKDVSRVRLAREPRPHVNNVLLHPRDRALADRHDAILHSFAFPD